MSNLITIEAGVPTVTMKTIEESSGLGKEKARSIVLANEHDFWAMSIDESSIFRKDSSGDDIDWDNLVFNKLQAMYLITIIGNSDKTKKFIKEIIEEFTTKEARDA